MPETMEIPRERWADYLNALSNRELNQAVRIQVDGEELGDQPLSNSLPLVGISVEEKGSLKRAIEITVGDTQTANFTHLIAEPEHVYVEEESGQVVCLDIEDRTHIKTLIFFDRVERPANAI